jgi:hypothetical protein
MKTLPHKPANNSVVGELILGLALLYLVCATWHGIAGGSW